MRFARCTFLLVLALGVAADQQQHRSTYLSTSAIERRVWIQYKEGQHDSCLHSLLSFSTLSSSPPVQLHYDFEDMRSFVITATDQEIEIMQANPMIEAIAEDAPRFAMYLPESVQRRYLQGTQEIPYGIRMVQADQAWQVGVSTAELLQPRQSL